MAVVTDDMHGPNRGRYARNRSIYPQVVIADNMLSTRNILLIAGVVALVVLVMRR